MSKRNQKPETTSAPTEATPDTNHSDTPPVDATPEEREQLLLKRVEQAEEYALATEERLGKHLTEARARIAELEITAARERMFDNTTIERIPDVGRPMDCSENQTVLAALDALCDREVKNPELREAAQRLRASTLPESNVVADAIRTLVEHHDPQDPTEASAG